MKLEKEQLIELYNLIYPDSIEKDEDIQAIDMEEQLMDEDSLILSFEKIKLISDWMVNNGFWYNDTKNLKLLSDDEEYCPECNEMLIQKNSGVKCSKCDWWFCY